MRRVVVGLVVFALAACGIDAVGTLEEPGALRAPDRPPNSAADGGRPAEEDGSGVPVGPCADACAPPSATAPFADVLYGERTSACPAGFDASDVVEDPVPAAGSCACGTCAFAGTSCTGGAIVSKYASDTTCSGTGSNLQGNEGNCYAFNGQFISTYAAMLAPAAVPGTCSAPGVGVPANVTKKERRVCTPRADACLDALCSPPAALAACIATSGDVPCPSSAPNRHLVGSGVALSCAACSCTTQATCTGTVTFYAGAGCTGATRVLQAGVCTQVNQASFQSTKWSGTVATQTCANVTPATTATASLDGARTVCCP